MLYPAIDNPTPAAESLAGPLVGLSVVGIGLLTIGSVGVAVSLLDRYRDAGMVVRLQLRWYIASAVGIVAGFCAFLAALLWLPPDSPLGEAILVAFLVSAALPPIALFVSITRYRLYDIDTILSRAFVFGTLTAILAGVYTASIRLFNSLFTALTGENSDAALVITTLVIAAGRGRERAEEEGAASFTPIKRRLEAFVERRFRAPESLGLVTDGDAQQPVAAAAATETLEDDIVGRIAAAVIADPAFGAAIESRLRLAMPASSAVKGAEPAQPPPLEERRPELG